jgi:hypothetical protein
MPESILEAVGGKIDQVLGLGGKGRCRGTPPHYKHKFDGQFISGTPNGGLDGHALVKAIYDAIDSNWSKRSYAKNPSPENWRLKKNPKKNDEIKNANRERKLEVRLEREIIDIDWPDENDWFNQIPVASGLVGARSDKRRAIDLVHRLGDGAYEFVELKVNSDTPLYAAMEILQYGVLYIFARRDNRIKDAALEKRLLKAKIIHLKVLAPEKYYKSYALAWIEGEIRKGLKHFLAERKIKLRMDFSFEAFPSSFSLHPFPSVAVIKQALSKRKPVWAAAGLVGKG